jgi:hypothetical protein
MDKNIFWQKKQAQTTKTAINRRIQADLNTLVQKKKTPA